MESDSELERDPTIHEYNSTRYNTLDHVTYITDYMSIPLCLAVICADSLLIYVIARYNVLRTRCNFHLLHYAICNLFNVICTPIFYSVLDIFFGGFLVVEWFCSIVQLENLFLSLFLVFVTLASLESVFEHKIIELYKKHYRYVIAFTYCLFTIIYLIVCSFCFTRGYNSFSYTLVTIAYVILMCVVISMNFVQMKYRQKFNNNNNYTLPITNIVILCWLPIFVYYSLMNVEDKDFNYWLQMTGFIPQWLANGSAIYVVYKLGVLNKYFKMAYRRVFKRSGDSSIDFERLNKDAD